MARNESPWHATARSLGTAILGCLFGLTLIDVVLASNAAVGLSDASSGTLAVPQWLYLATGGAVIGASALLASVVTDREFIRSVHDWRKPVSTGLPLRQGIRYLTRFIGVAGLVIIVYRGFVGPQVPTANAAVILVFAGVRAGLTMFVYLVGNVWPALNPWRTIAELLPTLNRQYPVRLGRWPAVVGLLALVWLETVTPVNKEPALLATAICVYSVVTLAGALVYTPKSWFSNADPISVTFRFYGSVGPLNWSENGITLRPPGFDLPKSGIVSSRADIAFVVALIWELTFSGFVTTTTGVEFVRTVVGWGLPPLVVYAALFVGGYLLFLGAFWLASQFARKTGETYLTPRTMAVQFAPPLLAIAAGYHLAHYFGFFVSLLPSFVNSVISPFSPPANPLVLTQPAWFGGLTIAFILVGHVLAVWLAHAEAYATFPSRIQAVRSQYPFVVVMIAYTVISLWLISLRTADPAFVS
ncbi:hypothetical protein SAMN05421858_3989 [Haladaptatus litoreus]|uniref:Uncharacterized protein n=1 Tax=Haladaptatus litoreus TaxID=553468 RepID=A0A1N7E3W0_9EURY|nr:hypothetical protein SAMN05421858_3989 [Haladaptatus litoreus]